MKIFYVILMGMSNTLAPMALSGHYILSLPLEVKSEAVKYQFSPKVRRYIPPVDEPKGDSFKSPLFELLGKDKNIMAVKKLLDEGAELHSMHLLGMNAIHKCALGGQEALHNAGLVLKYADHRNICTQTDLINNGDVFNNTPLHYAAAIGSVEFVKFLLMNGAKVNVANESGSTPLHEAVKGLGKSKNIYQIALLLCGWDKHSYQKNSDGKTAIDLARDIASDSDRKRRKRFNKLAYLMQRKAIKPRIKRDHKATQAMREIEINGISIEGNPASLEENKPATRWVID